MLKIKGISGTIVNELANRTIALSQGRNVACFGFIDEEGYICKYSEIVDGGLGGSPIRILFSKVTDVGGKPLISGMNSLPQNAVLISTKPGKTGVITDVSGVSFFDIPIIRVGVKHHCAAGVGIVYPLSEWFNLASEAEIAEIEVLKAETMKEELNILRKLASIDMKFLEVGEELTIVDKKAEQIYAKFNSFWQSYQAEKIKAIDVNFAMQLVEKSQKAGQGREVAALGVVDENGTVSQLGKTVEGGMGFVPSRLLASSYVDMKGISLRKAYAELIPEQAVIVHTHPGGTGVMHQGDASAGPSTWGRPIIAVGHDRDGKIKGATVIEPLKELFALDDEYEKLSLDFYDAQTPDEEVRIRNQRLEVSQKYTNLCRSIEIR